MLSLRSDCFKSRLKEISNGLLLLFGFHNVHNEVLHVIGRGFIEVFNQFVDLRSAQQIFGAEAADHGIEETADANGVIFNCARESKKSLEHSNYYYYYSNHDVDHRKKRRFSLK